MSWFDPPRIDPSANAWNYEPPGWQVCPVCGGTGRETVQESGFDSCPTCEGKRIINKRTGKPPKDDT